MPDNIKVKILPDGRLTIETDEISGENHMAADELLELIGRLAGGEETREKRIPDDGEGFQFDNLDSYMKI